MIGYDDSLDNNGSTDSSEVLHFLRLHGRALESSLDLWWKIGKIQNHRIAYT